MIVCNYGCHFKSDRLRDCYLIFPSQAIWLATCEAKMSQAIFGCMDVKHKKCTAGTAGSDVSAAGNHTYYLAQSLVVKVFVLYTDTI